MVGKSCKKEGKFISSELNIINCKLNPLFEGKNFFKNL